MVFTWEPAALREQAFCSAIIRELGLYVQQLQAS